MADKTPIRAVFTGSTATGLAEFQSGDTLGLTHGGLGASLSIGSAGQVIKVNSGASALEFGSVEAIVNIDGASDLTSNTLVVGDQLLLSDGGTEGRVTLTQLDTLFSGTTKTLTNKTLTAPTLTGTAVMADLDISGDVDVDGTLETDALSINGTTVTSTAAELNILDGNTSATSTTLAAADRMVINDNGTMVQVALTDLVTFLENGSVSGFDIDGGTY